MIGPMSKEDINIVQSKTSKRLSRSFDNANYGISNDTELILLQLTVCGKAH
jgi:hypothetical protein